MTNARDFHSPSRALSRVSTGREGQGVQTTETLSLVISSSFLCSEAFISSPLSKNKISDFHLPSLSCFGDCMSGNDDVLAVEDTDTRSPVTRTKKSSSTLHKAQETDPFLL